MEKNKNRRTFEFYKKNGKRETDTGEHKETKRGKRTGGTLRKKRLTYGDIELCEKTRCCVWAEQYYGSCLFSSLSGA